MLTEIIVPLEDLLPIKTQIFLLSTADFALKIRKVRYP